MKKTNIKIIVILLILVLLLGVIVRINFVHKICSEYKTNDIIAEQVIYNYPYKITIRILNNGNIKMSKIVDELTRSGAPKENFKSVGKLSNEEFKELKEIMDNIKKQSLNNDDYIEDNSIAIRYNGDLYGLGYFSRDEVTKLNNFSLVTFNVFSQDSFIDFTLRLNPPRKK